MGKLQKKHNDVENSNVSDDEHEKQLRSSLPHSLNKAETAAYISDVVLQLRNMAKSADLKFLTYFLEMSFQEAFSQSIGKGKDDN